VTQKITPCLWFDTQAEEAMNFYISVFKDSKVVQVTRCGDAGPGPKGSVLVATFEIEGQRFMVLSGNSQNKFNMGISLYVNCENQAEVDALWEKLTADGGAPVQCGWLTDKYGISWQIIPRQLIELLNDPDAEKSARVLKSMMGMVKIDVEELMKAAAA
jgi:predicted 3-demethylubiquinone-9 3-methyltransferase (glyoxalase superfamily)